MTNNNIHSLRLAESLRKNINDKIAKDLVEKYPLSQNAGVEETFNWAVSTCQYLEENLEPNEIIAVRKNCRCNDGKAIANILLKYLNSTSSILEFINAFNNNETFASLAYVSDNKLLFCYPECYCECVNRVPEELSKTWCYCTLGNAEGIFHEVFKKNVTINLLESIKTGGTKCVMEVQW
jgi:hypothetical protein